MRFFIFPLNGIYIAVEADKVKRFISPDALDDYVKIPVYLIFEKFDNASEHPAQHGIVLKQETNDNKTIMMITPPVERDIDVEENEIKSLPVSFKGIYTSFSGMYFSGQKIIFFLDMEKLSSLWLQKIERKKGGHQND